MEQPNELSGMLDLMVQPGFSVQNHIITRVNPAAAGCLIVPGTDVREILITGQSEYAAFQQGCLYLTVSVGDSVRNAQVTAVGQQHIFLLDSPEDPALRALALAAQQLRLPLSTAMNSTEQLAHSHPELSMGALTQGLYQLLRMVGNMADAYRYTFSPGQGQTSVCISPFLAEIFEKAAEQCPEKSVRLTFEGLSEPLYCPVNPELLERAVYNLLSNALKFTSPGGTILGQLTRTGKILYLRITDSGEGFAPAAGAYARQPGLTDCRTGIGLGLTIVRAAAACHGGTLLIDRPVQGGTRATLTLSLTPVKDLRLCSPRLQVDYAGERDHCLVELSDVLAPSAFREEN